METKRKLNKAFFCLLVSLCIITTFTEIKAQGFTHPGLLHTQQDFDRVKIALQHNNSVITEAYNRLKASKYSQSSIATYPTEIIIRGGGSGENYMNAARAAAAAYQNALRWKISGEIAHADKAVQILNNWAKNCKAVGGDTNQSLASGLYGYAFANAAELMRDYDGWKASDFKRFQEWMLYVFYPKCIDFLKRRHDTWAQGRPGHYWSNWGLCNIMAVISIGVLCDDIFIYNQGLSYYKNDIVGNSPAKLSDLVYYNGGLTEFVGNLIPVIHEDSRGPYGYLGQMQESGRDQGHALMALGLAVDVCQIAWNQGEDLFSYMDNRLAAGAEYVAAYNSGVDDLPWTEYWYHDVRTAIHNSWKQIQNNGGGRGGARPYWDRVIGHYEGVKGVEMTYSRLMKDAIGVDGGGGDYGETSGGFDHLGFSTLMCTRPVLEDITKIPVLLKPLIVYQGVNHYNSVYSGLPQGSILKLSPQLPVGEIDTNNWKWSTGQETKDLDIIATESGVYKVTYTNEKGIESSQLFTIAVVGDCVADKLTPHIAYNNVLYADSVIIVELNSSFTLSARSAMGYGSWEWSNGSTSSSIDINGINSDSIYSVVYTNGGGAKTKLNFHVQVLTIQPALSVDNGAILNLNKVMIDAGQSVTLKPVVQPGREGGEWKWSNGSIDSEILLENISETITVYATYTFESKEYKLDFHIYINPAGGWSYWPLDENTGTFAADVWNSRDAVVKPGVVWETGVAENGAKLDGTSLSYLQMPSDGFMSTLTDFTVALWVKLDAHANWARIWDFGRGTDNYMFLTSNTGSSSSAVRFAIKNGGAEQIINTSHVMQVGKWTHITVTKSGNTGILYINGTEAGRNSAITISPSNLGTLTQNYIGKSQFTSDAMLKGTVDDIRIYNEALMMDEVRDLVKSVAPDMPQNLSATVVSDEVKLSWDMVSGAKSYIVKRSTSLNGVYTVLSADVPTSSYTDTEAGNGIFFYIVSAVAEGIEGIQSNVVSTTLRPARPKSVIALGWDQRIDISWSATSGANGYRIYRSAGQSGPYSQVGETNGALFFSDLDNLTNNTTYYYVIRSFNAGGESTNSEEFAATPVNKAGFEDWQHSDVGDYVLTGNAGFNQGVLTVHGAGSQIYQKKDGFQYAYRQVTGDVGIVAKVLSLENTNSNAKAGVMIREQLTNNGMTAVSSIRADGKWEQVYRTANNADTKHPMSANSVGIPKWVKITRVGNEFKGYISEDGINWQEQAGGTETINMSGTVYIGVFALSHTTGALTKAAYDNVSIATALPLMSNDIATAVKGSSFEYSISASNAPYVYIAEGLPEGLLLDAATGKITGVPTQKGTFDVTLRVQNAMGEASSILTLAVEDGTLPISLIDYRVGITNKGVVINWSALSEQSNAYFILERKQEKDSYIQLDKVFSKGTGVFTYSLTDQSAAPGINYYRLLQVDKNGMSKELGTRSVNIDPGTTGGLKVYPQPVTGQTFTFEYNAHKPILSVQLADVFGKFIYNREFMVNHSNSYKVILGEKLPSGIYILFVNGVQKKIIVN